MKYFIVSCASVIALCAFVRTADSQAAAPANDPLNEIVVTATRSAQPLAQALEPVIVIDRAALEESLAMDVGDVLRFHAGLDIGRNGGPGQPLSLFIRGANSNQSIVMIDGVRINAGTSGLSPLEHLAPELFERIEIVEGPRSTIYGTDAIGGVVNFITRESGPSGADGMVDYGRYGTGEATVDGNVTAGETRLRAAFTGQHSAGYPTFAADTLDAKYQNLSGLATASTQVAGVDVGALYWQSTGFTHYAEANYAFVAPYNFAGYGHLSERFTNSALALHADGNIEDVWHARIGVSRVRDDLRQDQVDPFNALPAGDFDTTSRDTVDLQNDVKIAGGVVNQLVTFGAILADERTNSLSFGTPYSIQTHTQTYYVQDQFEAGRNRLLVAGGFTHHPSFGNHETWNAEYGYALTSSTLLIASAGTAFRAPSANDRFGYGGNPNLLPESSRNFELGVKSRLSEAQLLTFAAFQNSIDDLIFSVFNPVNFSVLNENIDRARIRGLEAGWELHDDHWEVRAAVSVQDPRNLSDPTDSQLHRRSRHSVTLSSTRRIGIAEVGVDVLQSGARQDVDPLSGARASDGGYFLASLHAKASLTPAWVVAVRLDNALDHRYQLANGYNTGARTASISTRYAFR